MVGKLRQARWNMSNGTPVMNFHGSHAQPVDVDLIRVMLETRARKWRRDALTFEPGSEQASHANTYARALEDSADSVAKREYLD